MINTNELVFCVSDEDVKFGTIKDTDVASWMGEVKEFTDLEGRVYIVSANHVNAEMEEGVDNIYEISKIMSCIWDKPRDSFLDNFSRYELSVVTDIYNLGEIEEEKLKSIERDFSQMILTRIENENGSEAGEEE